MSDKNKRQIEEMFRRENFDVRTLDDEIRIDSRCQDLLRLFRTEIMAQGHTPQEAGQLAWGADYFLREFIIADRRENIFALRPGRVRQFAGNWYIVKNLEPNMAELGSILEGVEAFYGYAAAIGKVDRRIAEDVQRDCADMEFYRQRIESFWTIEADGYERWERECSLKDPASGARLNDS